MVFVDRARKKMPKGGDYILHSGVWWAFNCGLFYK